MAYQNLIGLLAIMILVFAIMMLSHRRPKSCIPLYAAQSMSLALVAALVAYTTGISALYISAALTMLIKVFAIPKGMSHIIDTIGIEREVDVPVGIRASLLICGMLVVLSYYAVQPFIASFESPLARMLPIAMSVLLIGFFLMVSRRTAIMQLLGILIMENGIFLTAMSVTYGMPLVVELGIFFDVLTAALIIGLMVFRINSTFDSIDTAHLRSLKG
jgi:hydrogenase-4 component E